LASGLDIVVPAYNEEATIGELLVRLRRSCPGATVIVVDNGSSDGTVGVVEREREVRLVRHERNLGYGASLRDGIEAGDGPRIVMIDADLEYLPEDVPELDRALDSADAVFGSRFLSAGQQPRSAVWSLGNRTVTGVFNLLFAQRLTDLCTGLRGIRRAALPADGFRRTGFDVVIEIAAALARRGARLVEVPIGYVPRTRGRSKMRHGREAARFVSTAVRLRLGNL